MPFASVAMILTGARSDPEVLFIERARREGDRWSGQMAFPGGRVEESDRDLRDTAERETSEEVGIDLGSAELLGRLDDQGGRRFGDSTAFFIAAYVYYLAKAPALELSQEVEEALWVPAVTLTDPASRVPVRAGGCGREFPRDSRWKTGSPHRLGADLSHGRNVPRCCGSAVGRAARRALL